MKKLRLLSLFMSFILLFGLFTVSAEAAGTVQPPEIDVKAALLLDYESGEILYEQDADKQLYPASLTKVMTALLVFDAIKAGKLSLEQEVTASADAFIGLDEAGSTADICAGETMTVDNLLACMLINSANEAAAILGLTVGGTMDSFVALMNQKAAELGCANTHFANPTGLHDDAHYTSARDLYIITRAALQYPHFMELCNSKSWDIPATNMSGERTLHSTNALISNWRLLGYLYSGAQGIKTGHTTPAGNCLISTAVRDEHRLFGVILGADTVTRMEDGQEVTRTGSFIHMATLFDWGFDNFTRRTLITRDELVAEAPVALSREANYVVLRPAENISRMLPNDLNPEDLTRTVKLSEETFLAPVEAGAEMGKLTLSHDGKIYAEVPLVAMNAVNSFWLMTLHYNIVQFFSKTVVRLACIGLLLLLVLLFLRRNARRAKSRHGNPSRSSRRYRGRRRF